MREYHGHARAQARSARERQQLAAAKRMLGRSAPDEIDDLIKEKERALDARSKGLLDSWPAIVKTYAGEEHVVKVRGKETRTRLRSVSLSGTKVPKVALPRFEDEGEVLSWRLRENLPGEFPYTSITNQVYDSGSYVESLDRVLALIDERCTHSEGTYRDKRLALWELATLTA